MTFPALPCFSFLDQVPSTVGLFWLPFPLVFGPQWNQLYGFWGLEVYLGANKPANRFPPTLCCVLHWRPVAVEKKQYARLVLSLHTFGVHFLACSFNKEQSELKFGTEQPLLRHWSCLRCLKICLNLRKVAYPTLPYLCNDSDVWQILAFSCSPPLRCLRDSAKFEWHGASAACQVLNKCGVTQPILPRHLGLSENPSPIFFFYWKSNS